MEFQQFAFLVLLISSLVPVSDTWWWRRRRALAYIVPPRCSRPPPSPAYSSTSGCSSPYTHREICHYECHSGYYQTSGNNELTCFSGSWVGEALACRPLGCSTPSIPANSYKRGCSSPYSHEDICYYDCHSGYSRASGNTERTCSYGSWTGSDLECRQESLVSTPRNTDVEIPLTYELETGIIPLFENWKKLSNTGIASRTTANVYTSELYTGRIELVGQASLKLKNATKADEGTYQLFTVFSDGTSQVITATVKVTVDDPCENDECSTDGGRLTTVATITTDGMTGRTVFQATDLQTTEDTEVTEAILGSAAELHWNYSLTSSAQVIFEAWWFEKNGDYLIASRVHPLNISVSQAYEERCEMSSNTSLLLKAVGLADVGTYQLLAAFDDVSEPLRKEKHLVVHYPPRDVDITPSLTAAVGDKVILHPHTSSVPLAVYSWKKVNGSLPRDSAVNMTTGSLTLLNVAVEDGGEYMADATNYLGKASNITIIQVDHFGQPGSEDLDIDDWLPPTVILPVVIAAGIVLCCCIVLRKRKRERHIQDICMVPRGSQYPSVAVDSKFPIVHSARLVDQSFLGRGGFAYVKKARHLDWKKDVAVKCLLNGKIAGSEQELYSEARKLKLASKSDHVISLLGVCLEPNFAIVMPFMENGSLAGLLRDVNVPWALRWRMAHEISLGMTFLHCQDPQILHCDLKAENVLLDGDFRVKISDFGLSKWKIRSQIVTATSPVGGTITHAPPEYFLDINIAPTEKFDVYSFGVLLWEIATRKKPYTNAQNSAHIRFAVISGQRPDMTHVPTNLPHVSEVSQLMQRCWSQKPEDRPSFQG